jgi:hypothetical protein
MQLNLHILTLLLLAPIGGAPAEDKLVVYPPVPGLAASEHYHVRIRSAGDSGEWKHAFAWVTACKTIEKNSDAYFDTLAGWTHAYVNFEMSGAVEVEIARVNGQPILSAAVHPRRKASDCSIRDGKALVRLDQPGLVAVDIDGQMDGQDTGKGYKGPPIHAISIFANPPLERRPAPGDPGVLTVKPGETPPSDGPWTTLYFLPGVHDIGLAFPLRPNRRYYLPGDAMVYGTFSNTKWAEGHDIRIFGLGTLSGARLKNPKYVEPAIPESEYGRYRSIEVLGAVDTRVEGITLADSAFHSLMLVSPFKEGHPNEVRWTKIFTWRANGDGINPFGNTRIEDCFLRTQDDSLYVSGLGIRRTVLWNDANGSSFVLSSLHQLAGRTMRVEDCDVIYARAKWHHWTGGRVFNMRGEGGGAAGAGVVFRNINIEDPRPTLQQFFVCMTVPGPYSKQGEKRGPGDLSGLLFQNVSIAAPGVLGEPQLLWGQADARIRDLTFENLTVAGKPVLDAAFFKTNEFVDGLRFTPPEASSTTSAKPPPPRPPDGSGSVTISGELKQWHKVTLTLDGPFAHERDTEPNPFTDVAFNVTFTHESGAPEYVVAGYFAADGDAAESSAQSGTKWRAHLTPDKTGTWRYAVSMLRGRHVAVNEEARRQASPAMLSTGSFIVASSDKSGRDFRAHGRLQFVGKHHLQFAGSGEYFLKAGPDAPETLLAYADFDGTRAGKPDKAPLKTWSPHAGDWRPGDPTWRDGRGKGLIGALNYLAGKGVNSFSFLPYNAGGDGDNVWPFVERDAKLHYDCSKLDQWGVVFDHATTLGLHLHFKLQENEIDDHRVGAGRKPGVVPEALDGGRLGIERKLYCRELAARFGHALALNWNLGEENTQSTEEIRDMARFLHETDPYRHPIVLHTFPEQQDQVYTPLLGEPSTLTGTSLQNAWNQTHRRTLKWVRESARAGRPWVVANDEQGGADTGVPPDTGYEGYDGKRKDGKPVQTSDDIRKLVLWGNLMAGGAGVEYYFGYQLPQNDLLCEDFRSRDKSWDYCRIALDFFRESQIPLWEMQNANTLIGNANNDNSKFCLAKTGEIYLVYLPDGGTAGLDLSAAKGTFNVRWFNPRTGGRLVNGSVTSVEGGKTTALGTPPADAGKDWLIVLRR